MKLLLLEKEKVLRKWEESREWSNEGVVGFFSSFFLPLSLPPSL